MKQLTLISFLVAFLGGQLACNISDKGQSTQDVDYGHDDLVKKSIAGDSVAFSKLATWVMLQNKYHEIFYVTTIVANKYNYPDAYFLLYWGYIHPDPDIQLDEREQLALLDPRSRALCLYSLLKSRELGDDNAKCIANEIFKDVSAVPSANSYLDTLKNIMYTR